MFGQILQVELQNKSLLSRQNKNYYKLIDTNINGLSKEEDIDKDKKKDNDNVNNKKQDKKNSPEQYITFIKWGFKKQCLILLLSYKKGALWTYGAPFFMKF